MDTTYDIYMGLTDAGPPLWRETVTGLEEAKRRLAVFSSGTYMVFDSRVGTFIELPGSLPSNPFLQALAGSRLSTINQNTTAVEST
jgi:thioredoxin-related protein